MKVVVCQGAIRYRSRQDEKLTSALCRRRLSENGEGVCPS